MWDHTQVRTDLLTSGFSPWQHEERDTILTMLTPPQPAVHLVIFKISVRRDPKNPTTSFNGQNPTPWHNGQNPTLLSTVKMHLTSFQNPHFWAWRHPLSSPISCLGVYYDNWWLSYPLRASVKLHPMTMHLDSWPD